MAISLPREQLARVRREVRAGRAGSVSGYIARVLAEDEKRESLSGLLRELIEQQGEPTAKEKKWAERALAGRGLVLDAGALIALERRDGRMIALLMKALEQRRRIRVPAGVVGQAWRNGKLQATLARFLRSEEVEIVALDEALAKACGELCGATGSTDVIDASVVMVAREGRDPIVTSDPAHLRRLDSGAELIRVSARRSFPR